MFYSTMPNIKTVLKSLIRPFCVCFFSHHFRRVWHTECSENIFPQKMPLYVINFLRLSEPPKPYHLFFHPILGYTTNHSTVCCKIFQSQYSKSPLFWHSIRNYLLLFWQKIKNKLRLCIRK